MCILDPPNVIDFKDNYSFLTISTLFVSVRSLSFFFKGKNNRLIPGLQDKIFQMIRVNLYKIMNSEHVKP